MYHLGNSLTATKPTIPELREYALVQNVSLKAISNPEVPLKTGTLGDLTAKDDIIYGKELIREKHPDKADLLICMWNKESTMGLKMIGDHGLAIGHFHIHINVHPVSYECAMDLECSADYTSRMIDAGEGHLWTSFKKCL